MQPYFFPYLGYWQLIQAVDTFVIYDDVNFIKRGYINRNYILIGKRPGRITLELNGASQNRLINEITVGGNGQKILKTIELNYKKAPHFPEIFPLLQTILLQMEKNLAKYLGFSIQLICDYLELPTKILYSSEIPKDNTLKGQEKILAICEKLDADHYVNPIGGLELYNKETFKRRGIVLNFITMKEISYRQFSETFIPNLSIIDIMMFNDKDIIKKFLKEYELI